MESDNRTTGQRPPRTPAETADFILLMLGCIVMVGLIVAVALGY